MRSKLAFAVWAGIALAAPVSLRATPAMAQPPSHIPAVPASSEPSEESPSSATPATPLEAAQAAMAELRYEDALVTLEAALATGQNGPEDMKSIYRLLGIAEASLGQHAQAEVHFRSLLVLDPAATLDEGSSPKITDAFSAAKQAMGSRGTLKVTCEANESAVVLQVSADPLDMVAGARALYRTENEAQGTVEARGRTNIMLPIPVGKRTEVVCSVIDTHGNRLADFGSWEKPLLVSIISADEVVLPGRPWFMNRYLWAGITVAAAGAGGFFTFQTLSARSDLKDLNAESQEHSYDEAREIERRGERNALYTNISIGIFGVSAVVTGVLMLTHEDSSERRTNVAPVSMNRGAGFAVFGSF